MGAIRDRLHACFKVPYKENLKNFLNLNVNSENLIFLTIL